MGILATQPFWEKLANPVIAMGGHVIVGPASVYHAKATLKVQHEPNAPHI